MPIRLGHSRTCPTPREGPRAHGTLSTASRRSRRSWGRSPRSIYQTASGDTKGEGLLRQEKSNSHPPSSDSESEAPPESACPSSTRSLARAPGAPARWNRPALRSIHIAVPTGSLLERLEEGSDRGSSKTREELRRITHQRSQERSLLLVDQRRIRSLPRCEGVVIGASDNGSNGDHRLRFQRL